MSRQKNYQNKKPLGRLTPYAFFVQEMKSRRDSTILTADFLRNCANEWKAMEEIIRKKYMKMAESDKRRYQREMKNWERVQEGLEIDDDRNIDLICLISEEDEDEGEKIVENVDEGIENLSDDNGEPEEDYDYEKEIEILLESDNENDNQENAGQVEEGLGIENKIIEESQESNNKEEDAGKVDNEKLEDAGKVNNEKLEDAGKVDKEKLENEKIDNKKNNEDLNKGEDLKNKTELLINDRVPEKTETEDIENLIKDNNKKCTKIVRFKEDESGFNTIIPDVKNNYEFREEEELKPPLGYKSAYTFFVLEKRKEFNENFPEEIISLAEFSSQCSEIWKDAISEEEKVIYCKMAEEDKIRYNKEMEKYLLSKEKNKMQMPRRPLFSFYWFCAEERSKLNNGNENVNERESSLLEMEEMSKVLAKKWKSASANFKRKYEELAENDLERYKREIKKFRKGEFI